MTAIAERVAAGAAFLDEHDPGWDQRIDLDRLDLASPCRCVLGQLHVHERDDDGLHDDGLHYERAAEAFGLDMEDDEDARLGFDSSLEHESEYEHLTAEWRRVIEVRRAAP